MHAMLAFHPLKLIIVIIESHQFFRPFFHFVRDAGSVNIDTAFNHRSVGRRAFGRLFLSRRKCVRIGHAIGVAANDDVGKCIPQHHRLLCGGKCFVGLYDGLRVFRGHRSGERSGRMSDRFGSLDEVCGRLRGPSFVLCERECATTMHELVQRRRCRRHRKNHMCITIYENDRRLLSIESRTLAGHSARCASATNHWRWRFDHVEETSEKC